MGQDSFRDSWVIMSEFITSIELSVSVGWPVSLKNLNLWSDASLTSSNYLVSAWVLLCLCFIAGITLSWRTSSLLSFTARQVWLPFFLHASINKANSFHSRLKSKFYQSVCFPSSFILAPSASATLSQSYIIAYQSSFCFVFLVQSFNMLSKPSTYSYLDGLPPAQTPFWDCIS